jgi:signal peptidase I
MWWVILGLLAFFIFQDIHRIFKIRLPERKIVARNTVKSYFLIILLALFIRSFILQAYMIPSTSMEDTLKKGDFIFVTKFTYGIKVPFTSIRILDFHKPQRGEIIVFEAPPQALSADEPQKDFIKRCIGLPGEVVDIKGKEVYINGKLLDEPYAVYKSYPWLEFTNPYSQEYHFEIPKNNYIMLGDNRNNSKDSRYWKFLPYERIKGKAFLLYFPINRIKIIK